MAKAQTKLSNVRPFTEADREPRTGRIMDFIFTYGDDTEYTSSVTVYDGYKGDKGDGLRLKGSVETEKDLSLVTDPELGDCWLIASEGVVASWNGEEWLTTKIVGPQGEKGDAGVGIKDILCEESPFTDEEGSSGSTHTITFMLDDGTTKVDEYTVYNGKDGKDGADGKTVYSFVEEQSAVVDEETQVIGIEDIVFNLFVNGVQQPKGTVWEQEDGVVTIKGTLYPTDIVSIVYNKIEEA